MDYTMFTYEAGEQTLVIHLPRELDRYNCRSLKSDTNLLLDENYTSKIVLDFTHASLVDSLGTGVLPNRYKQMATGRGKVAYYEAGTQMRRILEMGRMNHLVQGYDNRESTLKE